MNTGQVSLDSCYLTAQGAQTCVVMDQTFKLLQVNHQLIDKKEVKKEKNTPVKQELICLLSVWKEPWEG